MSTSDLARIVNNIVFLEDFRYPALTTKQYGVISLLIEGRTQCEIAKKMNLSIKTVCTHKMTAMKKVGMQSLNKVNLLCFEQLIYWRTNPFFHLKTLRNF
jgi:DNA-binding NarL/FixJ family response regulator